MSSFKIPDRDVIISELNQHNQFIIDVLVAPYGIDIASGANGKVNLDEYVFKALIDTGASQSCVQEQIIDTLDLDMESMAFLATPSHKHFPSGKYAVCVGLLLSNGQINSVDSVKWNKSLAYKIQNTSHEYDVLLGMDILRSYSVFLKDDKCYIWFQCD